MHVVRHDRETEDPPGITVEISYLIEEQPGAVPIVEERSLVVCAGCQMTDDAGLGVDPWIEARLLSARWVGWHGESVTGKLLPGRHRGSSVAVEDTEGWGSTPPLRGFQGCVVACDEPTTHGHFKGARCLVMIVGVGFTPALQRRW